MSISVIEEKTKEIYDIFTPVEGFNSVYYGKIGNGKTRNATADIIELCNRGEVVYANWHIDVPDFDETTDRRTAFAKFLGGRKYFYKFKKENFHYFDPQDLIDNVGNVGIGVGNAPTAKLDIAGGNIILTNNANGGAVLNTQNGSVGTSAYSGLLVGNNLATSGGGFLILGGNYPTTGPYTSDGVYMFSNRAGGLTIAAEAGTIKLVTGATIKGTMLANGNLGLNETAPTNLLHLAGNVATPSLRLASTSTGYYWDIGRESVSTGDFLFRKASGGAASDYMRITNDGVIDLPFGQIKFPATQNASSNANTLDDYEEGTFTPTVSFSGGGSVTYYLRLGTYTKIGRQVTVNLMVNFSDNTGSGNVSIGNLPFTSNSTTNYRLAGSILGAGMTGLVGGLTVYLLHWHKLESY